MRCKLSYRNLLGKIDNGTLEQSPDLMGLAGVGAFAPFARSRLEITLTC